MLERPGYYHEAYKKRMMFLGAFSSLIIVSLIVAIKLIAYIATGSVAVLGALFDSGLDGVVSLLNLLAIRYALSPPDFEHRFGHGKIEPIASAAQGIFILVSALYLIYVSVWRLFHPESLQYMNIALVVAGLSMLLTFGLILVQSYVIKVTQSVVIRADALHYKGDLVINSSVIFSAVAAGAFQAYWVDAALGIFISLFISISAIRIIFSALHQLLDHELTDDHETIKKIILSHEKVLGFHDLRTRQSSIRKFMQFHLDLPPDMLLKDAHAVAQEVEQKLLAVFPQAEIMIHQDPAGCDTHDDHKMFDWSEPL